MHDEQPTSSTKILTSPERLLEREPTQPHVQFPSPAGSYFAHLDTYELPGSNLNRKYSKKHDLHALRRLLMMATQPTVDDDPYRLAIEQWRAQSVPLLPPATNEDIEAIFAQLDHPPRQIANNVADFLCKYLADPDSVEAFDIDNAG